ncbi:hypothetical protein C8Q74DRAFT_135744 [Fomes fomentarius]|nr:hypothetical protein C8Q74DRAFT_135744 [Fomes fomentarius]
MTRSRYHLLFQEQRTRIIHPSLRRSVSLPLDSSIQMPACPHWVQSHCRHGAVVTLVCVGNMSRTRSHVDTLSPCACISRIHCQPAAPQRVDVYTSNTNSHTVVRRVRGVALAAISPAQSRPRPACNYMLWKAEFPPRQRLLMILGRDRKMDISTLSTRFVVFAPSTSCSKVPKTELHISQPPLSCLYLTGSELSQTLTHFSDVETACISIDSWTDGQGSSLAGTKSRISLHSDVQDDTGIIH